MENQDKTLVCKECDKNFTLTKGEQEFFRNRNLAEPKRCKNCRQKRKVENKFND